MQSDNDLTESESPKAQKGNIMKRYEIKYEYEGKQYTTVEQPTKGWEEQFLQNVLNRIESLTQAGAKIIDLERI